MNNQSYDVAVLGGGPGGYVAAIRAAQLGLKTVCVESRPLLGGTCLNVGCIPSKALLESSELFLMASKSFASHGIKVGAISLDLPAMMGRKGKIIQGLGDGISSLFKKNKIDLIRGKGRLEGAGKISVTGESGEKNILQAHNIILATGSETASLPSLPVDGQQVIGSTEALSLSEPPKDLLVIGAGFIGLELGSVWKRLGSNVVVLEFLPKALPQCDGEMAHLLQRSLEKQGLSFSFETRVTGGRKSGSRLEIQAERNGKKVEFLADKALVCVGRKANSTGIGLEELGVQKDPKTGQVLVDAYLRTNVSGVYAIGDLVPGPMLAHKAEDEGIAAAENIAGGKSKVHHENIPSVVYTWPELAGVGKTEEQLQNEGIPYRAGKFPFLANSRARTMGETEGWVKILAHEKTDRVLGAHIFGPRASEMISEAVAWIETQSSSQDIAMTCHAHPSLSEAFREAALAVSKKAIHI
ncbi:MAG: dihydrolipoyl dehydrogenase [Gemmataceae bacterium]|nr:dihydrolipoyl dehydrogenase [Gemmataceae bacterium]